MKVFIIYTQFFSSTSTLYTCICHEYNHQHVFHHVAGIFILWYQLFCTCLACINQKLPVAQYFSELKVKSTEKKQTNKFNKTQLWNVNVNWCPNTSNRRQTIINESILFGLIDSQFSKNYFLRMISIAAIFQRSVHNRERQRERNSLKRWIWWNPNKKNSLCQQIMSISNNTLWLLDILTANVRNFCPKKTFSFYCICSLAGFFIVLCHTC